MDTVSPMSSDPVHVQIADDAIIKAPVAHSAYDVPRFQRERSGSLKEHNVLTEKEVNEDGDERDVRKAQVSQLVFPYLLAGWESQASALLKT